MTENRLLYRIPEAAALTGLGRSTIYELIGSGAISVVRVGRAVRVPAESLRRWVAEQTAEAERAASS